MWTQSSCCSTYFCYTVLLVRVLQVRVDHNPKWYRWILVVNVAVHSLPARRTGYCNITIDKPQLRLRPKNIFNNTHHVHIGVELTPEPFWCQRRHDANVLRRFALVPLLELFADVDICV